MWQVIALSPWWRESFWKRLWAADGTFASNAACRAQATHDGQHLVVCCTHPRATKGGGLARPMLEVPNGALVCRDWEPRTGACSPRSAALDWPASLRMAAALMAGEEAHGIIMRVEFRRKKGSCEFGKRDSPCPNSVNSCGSDRALRQAQQRCQRRHLQEHSVGIRAITLDIAFESIPWDTSQVRFVQNHDPSSMIEAASHDQQRADTPSTCIPP